MKKENLREMLPRILIVLFLVAGISMLIPCICLQVEFSEKFIAAQNAASDARSAAADIEEGELSQLQDENKSLAQSVADLRRGNAELDMLTAGLQKKYDTLAQEEDNQYYLAIIESLKEGMELVEQYINEAQ